MKRALLEVSSQELAAWMVEQGYPGFHARQVLRWVFQRRVERFESMSDLPKRLREHLDAEWAVFGTEVAYHHVSPDGTDKLLLGCADGRRIECVLMA
jgi:23S rRNA (adenine2503-C2)-methyltransferase